MSIHHVPPPDNFTIVPSVESQVQECLGKADPDEAFWLADMSRVRESLDLWQQHLAQVEMHYAVKCCNEPTLLKYLAGKRSIGFDCASKAEIETMMGLGVDPNRIVFAHPIKSIQAIRHAKEVGVERLVFDTPEELKKILHYYPDAKVFLRVKPKFTHAKIQLSNKFGAAPEDVPALLRLCVELNANFIGFSFHVGSLCDDVQTFKVAFDYVAELRSKAESLGLHVTMIDMGGGFLSPNAPCNCSFVSISEAINGEIDRLFNGSGIKFLAEPGRFVSSEYMDIHLPVTCVKIHTDDNGNQTQSVFIPDGIYGAFNALNYDHAEPHFEMRTDASASKLYNTTLWGQTCDSADIVYEGLRWPKLEVGDLLSVRKFSAYTYSPTSFFNGFAHHRVFVFNENDEESHK